jgi:hypothetical protein
MRMVYEQGELIPSSCRNEESIMPAFRMPKDLTLNILGLAWFIIGLFVILFLVSLLSGN